MRGTVSNARPTIFVVDDDAAVRDALKLLLRSVGQAVETFGSGQALRGQAGNSGFGLVQSGALEASNVDITEQLVNMITAQRNFQANAQMISTADAITQTIINIR